MLADRIEDLVADGGGFGVAMKQSHGAIEILGRALYSTAGEKRQRAVHVGLRNRLFP
jgi:hypothetical protein